jgi:hypothetical protein
MAGRCTEMKQRRCHGAGRKSISNAFLEWAAGDRLRHSRFVGLRDDNPRMVVKEYTGE